MEVFVPLLVKQMDNITAVGIEVNIPSGLITQSFFGIFDLIAKAPMLSITQLNGNIVAVLHVYNRVHDDTHKCTCQIPLIA